MVSEIGQCVIHGKNENSGKCQCRTISSQIKKKRHAVLPANVGNTMNRVCEKRENFQKVNRSYKEITTNNQKATAKLKMFGIQ